jgi:hypothetical protein
VDAGSYPMKAGRDAGSFIIDFGYLYGSEVHNVIVDLLLQPVSRAYHAPVLTAHCTYRCVIFFLIMEIGYPLYPYIIKKRIRPTYYNSTPLDKQSFYEKNKSRPNFKRQRQSIGCKDSHVVVASKV